MRKNSFRDRTELLLGPVTMEKMSKMCIAVAGLGGVGGAVLMTLARMGFQRFRIADPASFDEPDMNRQWAAMSETLGQNKAHVYEHFIRSINPEAEVVVFDKGVTVENAEEFVDGSHFVVEALDIMRVLPETRQKVCAEARKCGIPVMLAVIIGFATVVAISSPSGMPLTPFLEFIESARCKGKLPVKLVEVLNPVVLKIMGEKMAQGTIPSISLATGLVSAVASTEILMALCGETVPGGRPPVYLPEVTFVDISKQIYQIRRIEEFKV